MRQRKERDVQRKTRKCDCIASFDCLATTAAALNPNKLSGCKVVYSEWCLLSVYLLWALSLSVCLPGGSRQEGHSGSSAQVWSYCLFVVSCSHHLSHRISHVKKSHFCRRKMSHNVTLVSQWLLERLLCHAWMVYESVYQSDYRSSVSYSSSPAKCEVLEISRHFMMLIEQKLGWIKTKC